MYPLPVDSEAQSLNPPPDPNKTKAKTTVKFVESTFSNCS